MALTRWRGSSHFGQPNNTEGFLADTARVQSGFTWGVTSSFNGGVTGALQVGGDMWTVDPAVTSSLTGTASPTGASMLLTPIWLPEGFAFSSITFFSAATAVGTGTHQEFGLYDQGTFTGITGGLALVAQTTDDTSTAWAANTPKTLWLSTTASGASGTTKLHASGVFQVKKSGIYYVAIALAGTTQPTLVTTPVMHAAISTANTVTGAALRHLGVKDSVNTSIVADLPTTAQVGTVTGTTSAGGGTTKVLRLGVGVGTITGVLAVARLS
jgi:hypothetical protein